MEQSLQPQDKEIILPIATKEGVAYGTQQDVSARDVHFFKHAEEWRLTWETLVINVNTY